MDLITHVFAGALVGHAVASGTPASDTVLLTAMGAVSGCLPDLDALTRYASNTIAWRYHRVALHGLWFVGCVFLVGGTWAVSSPHRAGCLPAVITLGLSVLLHLTLDATTSFGTTLLFPFSRWRAALRTHFIVDPLLTAPVVAALIVGRPLLGFLWIALHIVLSLTIRISLTAHVQRRLINSGMSFSRISLEPKPFAPFCWLVIIDCPDRYLFTSIFLWKRNTFFETEKGNNTAAKKAAQRSPLLMAFLDTCDFPRFEDITIENIPGIIVEDVKWWLWLPFRPHAFSAKMDVTGNPYNVRQSSYFDRGPMGIPEPPPIIRSSINS